MTYSDNCDLLIPEAPVQLEAAEQRAIDADNLTTCTAIRPVIDLTGVSGIREIATANATGNAGRVFTTGRDAKGCFARPYRHVRLYVTNRGHWYRGDDEPDAFHNDILCRGCGHHGHFPYILDYKACPKPPSTADVIETLRTR